MKATGIRHQENQDLKPEARDLKPQIGRREMNPVVDKVARWREEGRKAALATVVKVERSGPLGPGTSMAVSEDGQVVGSVSGGCVEPAVFEEAMGAIETGEPRLLSYGISDDEAFGVGLTCGGVIHIFVERVDW
jgi:xanthine/CO dehydrogenase XdhC/CoxF family maturation factor